MKIVENITSGTDNLVGVSEVIRVNALLKSALSEIIHRWFKETKDAQLQKCVESIVKLKHQVNLLSLESRTIVEYIDLLMLQVHFSKDDIGKFALISKDHGCREGFWQIDIDEILEQSPRAAKAMAEMYYIPHLEKEITSLLQDELNYMFNQKQNIEVKPSKLEQFEKSLESIVVGKMNIRQYVAKFNENQFLPNIDYKKFEELSNRLIKEAAKTGKEKEICEKFWGKELTEVFTAIRKEVKQIKTLSTFEVNGNEITCAGYIVKISAVAKFVAVQRSKVEHVRIFGLNEVVFDTDLALSGINVSIISPIWNIESKININLKGNDGINYDVFAVNGKHLGSDGENGKSGFRGDNGGCFFGIGDVFINWGNLNINTDGGNGGAGQQGGNGAKGRDNHFEVSYNDKLLPLLNFLKYVDGISNTLYSNEFKNFCEAKFNDERIFEYLRFKWHQVVESIVDNSIDSELESSIHEFQGFLELAVKQFNEADLLGHKKLIRKASSILMRRPSVEQIEHQLTELGAHIFGQPTQLTGVDKSSVGGNAGKGGRGGLGGSAGSCLIISTSNQIEKKPLPKAGMQGACGQDGYVGSGGKLSINLINIKKSGLCCAKSPISPINLLTAPSGVYLRSKSDDEMTLSQASIYLPNVRLSIIDYQIIWAQKSKLAYSMSKSFNRKLGDVQVDENAASFASELLKLEENIGSLHTKFDFLAYYNDIAQRISNYADKSQDYTEAKILKYLYTSALTRLSQLNAASKSRLVIDVDKFLSSTRENISKLEKKNNIKTIKSYKEKYAREIEAKIEEARFFVTSLVRDIERSGNALDDQLKKHLEKIEQDIKAALTKAEDLAASRDQIQNAVIKMALFGTLGILISSVGSAFGPPGVALASVVGAGINILTNPRDDDSDGLIESLQNLSASWGDAVDVTIDDAQNKIGDLISQLSPAMTAIKAIGSKAIQTKQAKLASVTTALKQAEGLISHLKEHKKYMVKSFSQKIKNITDQVKSIHDDLENKSVVAVEFNKLEVRSFFKTIKAEISKIVGSPEAADGFCDIISKMIEAIETSMNIYEHIQEYKDQITFANYIAQVSNPGFKDDLTNLPELKEVINLLDKALQRNITLEQYYSAVSLIKQWAFPFAGKFLDSFDKLSDFLRMDDEDFASEISEKVENIIQEVVKDKIYISAIDQAVRESDFIDEPFFVWSYANHPKEIQDILNGKQVFLNADVSKGPLNKAAVKFMELRLSIKITHEEYNTKIKSALSNYEIELQHSGNSYYRYAGNTYAINHDALKLSFSQDLRSYNATFKKIHECSKDNPMLSPYTWWGIQLKEKVSGSSDKSKAMPKFMSETNSQLFIRFKDVLSQFEIQLIGRGRYIDESELPEDESFNVDSYYDRVVAAVPKLRLEDQIKQLSSKPNALNQRSNPNYFYKTSDVETIQKEIFKSYKHNFTIYSPIQNDDALKVMIESFENQPILCVYELQGSLAILRDSKGDKIALYKDHLGHENEELSAKLKTLGISRVIFSSVAEVEEKSPAIPILILKNLQVIAEQIRLNKNEFINDFSQYAKFTDLSSIKVLREHLAQEFIGGKYEQIKEQKEIAEIKEKILKYHQKELESLLDDFQAIDLNLKIDGNFYEDEDNTASIEVVVLDIDRERSNYTYGFNTTFSNDIDESKAEVKKNLFSIVLDGECAEGDPILKKKAKGSLKDLLSDDFLPAIEFSEVLSYLSLLPEDIDSRELAKKIYDAKDGGLCYLRIASQNCNIASIREFIDKGIDINKTDHIGRTLLHWAAFHSNADAVGVLLDKKIKIDTKDKDGWTALHLAVDNGFVEGLELLLKKKADPNAITKTRTTPLHLAGLKGHLEVLNLLVRYGGRLQAKNDMNNTVLHYAAMNGYTKVIKFCLDKGMKMDDKGDEGHTPLHWASYYGREEALELLLNRGADIEARNDNKRNALDLAAEQGLVQSAAILLNTGFNVCTTNEYGWSALHHAAKYGHLAFVQYLLERGADVDAKTENNTTPLHLAGINDHIEVIKFLLDQGADISAKDEEGQSIIDMVQYNCSNEVIHFLQMQYASVETDVRKLSFNLLLAARLGDYEAIVLLLNRGADIETVDEDDNTPLKLAITDKHYEVVKLLLSRGANIEFKDKYGTCLHHAISRWSVEDDVEIIRVLLDNGANVNALTDSGQTPLHWAADGGRTKVAKLLLDRGAKLQITDQNGKTALDCARVYSDAEAYEEVIALLEAREKQLVSERILVAAQNGDYEHVQKFLDQGDNIETKGEQNLTALHHASRNGHLKVVEFLLTRGAKVHATGDKWITSLHLAAKNGHREVTECLLNNGANIEAIGPGELTPLLFASYEGHKDVVEVLLNKRANLGARDDKGLNALSAAIHSNQLEVVKLLLDKGLKLDDAFVGDTIPLHVTAQNGYTDMAELLLAKKAKIDAVNKDGWTALHHAAFNNCTKIIELLISKGANINIKNSEGQTPLHLAAINGQINSVQILLDRGADAEVKDNNENTALDLAHNHKHLKIVQLFNPRKLDSEYIEELIPNLFKSIKDGDVEATSWLLDQGADIESKDHNGSTALIQAVENNHVEVVKLLLDRGANVESLDDKGFKPLLIATLNRNLQIVQLLLNKGADIEAKCANGGFSLMIAAQEGDLEIVKLLLSNGANINAVSNEGYMALDVAKFKGHQEVVEFLQLKGALSKVDVEQLSFNLLIAAQKGDLEEVTNLLNKGANLENKFDNYYTTLFIAVQHSHIDLVSFLLGKGANVEVKNGDGIGPVHFAAIKNDIEILKLLVEKSPNLEIKDNEGWTPLLFAAEKNSLDAAKFLLEIGADIEAITNDGLMPLHFAAYNGYVEILELLISKGANLKAITAKGSTPLHFAAQNGHVKAVQLLLDKGADAEILNQNGQKPLDLADNTEVISLLCRSNTTQADVGGSKTDLALSEKQKTLQSAKDSLSSDLLLAMKRGKHKSMKILIESGASIHTADSDGQNPLHFAAAKGHLDLIKLIMDKGGNPDLKDKEGRSALDLATINNHTEAVRLLKGEVLSPKIEAAPTVEASSITQVALEAKVDDQLSSDLILAMKRGNQSDVKNLIEKGASIYVLDQDNQTPLHWAARKGHTDIIRLILSKNPNLEGVANEGATPLILAARFGHQEAVRLLLESGANVSSITEQGSNALHWASLNGHCTIVGLLLDKGADIGVKNRNESTPLHLAASKGQEQIIHLLLNRGANIKELDRDGKTPLDLAKINHRHNVVQLLLDKGFAEKITTTTPILATGQDEIQVQQVTISPSLNVTALSESLLEAIKTGRQTSFQNCLDQGADIEFADQDGQRPLHYAAAAGYKRMVQGLLEKGADVESRDKNDQTPLFSAVQRGDSNIVKILLDKRSKVDIVDKNGSSPAELSVFHGFLGILQLLVTKGASLDVKNSLGETLLHIAAAKGHLEIVDFILGHKGNKDYIEIKDLSGFTPLHKAANQGHMRVVDSLLTKGANIYSTTTQGQTCLELAKLAGNEEVSKLLEERVSCSKKLSSDLLMAVQSGKYKIVESLLKGSASINFVDSDNQTLLHIAAKNGHVDIIQFLINRGIDIESITKKGLTPLILAVQKNQQEAVKLLLDKGANVDAATESGNSSLHWAVLNGYDNIAEILLNAGADLKIRNNDGQTPLHLSVQKGNLPITQLFLDRGANIQVTNATGKTILDLAIENNHEQIIHLLKAKVSGDSQIDENMAANINAQIINAHPDSTYIEGEGKVEELGDVNNLGDVF